LEDEAMQPVRRIGTIAATLAAGLLLASQAEAGDRHRGERIDDGLDFVAAVAALSGDYALALALDRRGDRIERLHALGWRDPGRLHRRSLRGHAHHRHFAGCGHREIRRHLRHDHRAHHAERHARRHHRHDARHHH
jgi:hypothetical protein